MKKVIYTIALPCIALLFCGAGVSLVFPRIDMRLNSWGQSDRHSEINSGSKTPGNKDSGVKTYQADLNEGVIGINALNPADDPFDNVFHFQLDEAPAAGDAVWLCYELNGVQDHSAVARSINTHQSVGGYFVRPDQRWSLQRERIDGAWLHPGDNVVRFSLPADAGYAYRVRSIQFIVDKKGTAALPGGTEAIVVNQASGDYYGNQAYVKGFLSGAGANSARLFSGGTAVETVQGEFEYIATKPAHAAEDWALDLHAVYPDGRELHQKVSFNSNQKAAWVRPLCAKGRSQAQRFEAGSCGDLNAFGAALEVPEGALTENKTITVTALRDIDLPALDPDLVNVSKNGGGFRFLPDGLHFKSDVELRLEYDPCLIPEGYTEADIRTYYFDESDRRWKMLLRDTFYADYTQVVSKTNHFTDYINGIIKVPESAPPHGYQSTEIKDLKAGDASAGIPLIAPPTANNMGAATVQFPIKLPPGRQGMQPQLAIQYNSEGGNGWLGLGWDLSVPSIALDTRWGVPRYDPGLETETYLMGGSQLIPLAHRAAPVARSSGDKQFYPRVEGAFQKIIRHGNSPKNYWWEVVNKDGSRSFYGGDDNSELKDADNGNVAQWFLREVRDLNGNFIRYHYAHAKNTGLPNGTVEGRQVYPEKITYTGFGNEEGPFSVEFIRDGTRKDVQISGRLGFKQVTADRLERIEVSFKGKMVRSYALKYKEGAFFKSLLASVAESDGNGVGFYQHEFEYFNEVSSGGTYKPFKAQEQWTVPNDDIRAGLLTDFPGFRDRASLISGSRSSSYGIGAAITFGPNGSASCKTFSVGGNFNLNGSSGDGLTALVDINGDGLPDKVYREDGVLKFRANLAAPGGQPAFSDNAVEIKGVTQFSTFKTRGNSKGVEANLSFFFVGHTWSKSQTITDTYFADFNGDRLIDIAHKGRVYFNHIEAGIPIFTLDSDDTPNPIVAGAEIDPTLVPITPGELDTLIDENPLHDVVRIWEAPFDGTVKVDAPIELIQDNSPDALDYKHQDGVRATVQFNEDKEWPLIILPASAGLTMSLNLPSSFSVKKGDRFYFRLQSIMDGAYDKVIWDPQIKYQNINTPEIDPNAQNPAIYQASKDFILTAPQSAAAPLNGTIRVESLFKKTTLSDSIRLEIVKKTKTGTSIVLSSTDYGWNGVVQDSINTEFHVDSLDEISFRMIASTNINWTAVSWKPHLFYKSFDNGMPAQYPNQNYLLDFYPAVEFTMFNDLRTRPYFWVAPDSGKVKIDAFSLPGFPADHHTLNGVVTLSAKGVRKLFGKTSFAIINGQISINEPTEVLANVQKGDSLFIEYHIQNDTLVDSLINNNTLPTFLSGLPAVLSFNGSSDEVIAGVFTRPKVPWLGPMHRGWGFFVYNGNRKWADEFIHTDELKKAPGDAPGNIPNQDSDIDPGYNPVNARYVMLYPDCRTLSWNGFDDLTWVKADRMSSSRFGEDDLTIDYKPAGGSGATAPRKITRFKSKNLALGSSAGFISGSATKSDGETEVLYAVQDMNADGYPDIVSSEKTHFTNMLGGLEQAAIPHLLGNQKGTSEQHGVTLGGTYTYAKGNRETKNGTGCTATAPAKGTNCAKQSDDAQKSASVSGGISGSFSNGTEETLDSWLDLNGDGLPDKVYKNGMVSLNLGYSFAKPEDWDFKGIQTGQNEDIGGGASLGINYHMGSIMAGIGLSRTENNGTLVLQDVNGDGLTDRIWKDSNGQVFVNINLGNGFSDKIPWNGAESIDEGISIGESVNGAFTVCFNLFFFRICFNPSGSLGRGASRQESQLTDIDGDGFPDFLYSDNDGELRVKRSTIGRTNLLKSVERPMGSSFTLDYQLTGNTYDLPQSKWVLSDVDVYDGLPGDGADHMKTSFTYSGGRYDRREREFYGFQTMTTRQLDTKNNNATYRTIAQTYKNDSYYMKGLLLRERMEDNKGNPYTETENTYELRDPVTLTVFDSSSLVGRGYPVLLETQKLFYEGQPVAGLKNRVAFVYDSLGNVVQYTDYGDGTTGDKLTATIAYHYLAQPNIKSIPKSIEIKDSDGQRLRYREADIDNTGSVIQIRQYLSSGDSATFDMVYDGYGNMTKITRPKNAEGQRLFYAYTYDDVVHTYATQVKDAYGYSSGTKYDYSFGLPLESVDINNERIIYSLDANGRIDSITGPYELAAGKPYTIQFEYHPEAQVPYAITRHYDPANKAADIETITFMDGLQRPVQVKKTGSLFTAKNSTDSPVMIVSGRVNFDAFGRAVENYYPVTEAISGDKTKFNGTPDGVTPTQTAYDVLDRKVSVTLPDKAKTSTQYDIADDHNGYTCFRTTVIDALNHSKENYTDIRGRTRAVKENGLPTGIWTDFQYNLLGELLQAIDNAGNVTEYTYDLLGRRLSVKHPDAGLTKLQYDLVGNVTQKVTPNIRAVHPDSAIKYTYDYERLIQVDYPFNYQNIVRYHYGEPGAKHRRAGRIWLQEDASGGQEFFFGPLGEVEKTIRTMLISNIRMITYVSESRYDTWNRIDTMIYPDGEIVKYHYNSAGKLSSMTGFKLGQNYTYVERLGYDKFEQRSFLRLGNGTETNYSFEPERRRLHSMDVTDKQGRTFMNNAYAYDAVDNILSLQNQAPVQGIEIGGPATHNYTYDGLYRLTDADGVWSGPTRQESYTLHMEYDELHNIRRKTEQHLNNGSVINGTTYDLNYAYDSGRPHIPTRIGDKTYLYDANGNLSSWARDQFQQNRYIHWDEENRIQDIWEDGYLSQYTYDAAGERAIKSHGGLQVAYTNGAPAGAINHRDNFTAYVSPYLVAHNLEFTKHYYIEGQRILSKMGTGKFYYPLPVAKGQYVTAGDLDYQKRMDMLAYFESIHMAAPAAPGNPQLPPSGLQPTLPDPNKFNHLAWDLPKTTNDNVKPGFNLRDSVYFAESNVYYFHPDHLGSTSYVTDFNGKLRQHVEYMPFGETFVDEHLNTDPLQPYLYNAKELDAETGLYYYGARYYDPKVSMWASVDPMAEKYPGWSPYNYTMLNPVRLVDPDGKEPITAIFEGIVAFGITASIDFTVSMASGQDAKTAFNNINWREAITEGASTTAMALVLPPGASTASKVAKFVTSTKGELVINSTKNILKGVGDDSNYDDDGRLQISKVLSEGVQSAVVESFIRGGKNSFTNSHTAEKKLSEQYDRLSSKVKSSKQLENITKKIDTASKTYLKSIIKESNNEVLQSLGIKAVDKYIDIKIEKEN